MKRTHLLRNCSWKFKCERLWDSLLETKSYRSDKVRFCPDCSENVYFVSSESEVFLAIEQNKCIAIPFEITDVHKQMNKTLIGSIKKIR
jgi:hypothetical protein